MPEPTDRTDPIAASKADLVHQILVSVIIPSWDASRSGNLPLLLAELNQQSTKPDEFCVVEHTSPNGHARNVGVERSHGEILVFLDDDVRLGCPDIVSSFVDYLTQHPDLGMVGTSQLLPPDSSTFQKKCAEQLTRCQSPVVEIVTDSDMVTTQCCALRRSVLQQVGGFHDKILRGVDPELRHRVRQAGFRVAVVPSVWHYHPMPANLKSLLQMAWRDGTASAFARRHFPETILFNPDGHVGEFQARRPFILRICNNIGRLLKNIATGRAYGTLYGIVYAGANLVGGVRRTEWE